MKALSHFCINI